MSEFVPEIAKRYTDLMAPAFVEGCQQPVEPFSDEMELDVLPLLAMALMQPPIRDRLRSVDWEASGLPTKSFNGPEDSFKDADLSPGRYADRLMAFAFDDAYTIIKQCSRFVQKKEPPSGASLKELLLNGKKNLLMVARLPENHKNNVYRQLEYPELNQLHIEGALPVLEDPIILGQDTAGKKRFEWHPEISRYISDHVVADRGCPAAKHVVEVDGHKQTLMAYFWDKLVAAMYSTG